MDEAVRFHFVVDGEDFTSAGQASVQVKKNLRKLGISPEVIDSSFRVSLSRDTTAQDIDALVDGIMNVLRWKNHR